MAAHRMTTQLALMPKTPGSRLQLCLRLQSLCKATPSPAALALLALAAARPGRCLGLAVCWLICTQGRSTGTVGRGSTTTIALRQGRPATRPELSSSPRSLHSAKCCEPVTLVLSSDSSTLPAPWLPLTASCATEANRGALSSQYFVPSGGHAPAQSPKQPIQHAPVA